jgi:hypothetical protein
MDKRVINEEQFRKLVISEAKKFISEDSSSDAKEKNAPESRRKISFDKVESLIKEMEQMPKSIKSISLDDDIANNSIDIVEESTVVKPNRDLDVIEHNKKKNIIHVNEGEKDKWNRMLNYKIPSDEQR